MRINKLTPAQESQIAVYREKWLKIGLSTAESGDDPWPAICRCYEAANLPPPKIRINLPSPMHSCFGCVLLTSAQVRAQAWAQVGDQVGAQVRDQVWAQVGAQVGDKVGRSVYGHHDAGWLSWFAYFAEVCGIKEGERLHGINEVAKSCGWWWPFENAVILTERPTQIYRDADHRLHNDTGSALLYPDGWGIWAIHGLRMDRKIIEAPETLTAAEVRDERNAEIRRHMLDRYKGLRGAEAQRAWIQDLRLMPISVEDITEKLQPSALTMWRLSHGDKPCECKLYKAKVPDDEDLAILMVTCTSTLKEVSLRVPPTIKTAAEARAWTFGGVNLAEAVET